MIRPQNNSKHMVSTENEKYEQSRGPCREQEILSHAPKSFFLVVLELIVKYQGSVPSISLHPGKLTCSTPKWRFGSDDFPFQVGDV